jgi:hypothetical protein
MIQNILTIIIGIVALGYVIRIFPRQLSKSEVDPKCENCSVPELMNPKKN